MAINGGNPDPERRPGRDGTDEECPFCGAAVVDLPTHLRDGCEGAP